MYKVIYTPEGKYQATSQPTEFTYRDQVAAIEQVTKLHINARENDLQCGRDYSITFTEEG
jgi:hypothetical protein